MKIKRITFLLMLTYNDKCSNAKRRDLLLDIRALWRGKPGKVHTVGQARQSSILSSEARQAQYFILKTGAASFIITFMDVAKGPGPKITTLADRAPMAGYGCRQA
jgi:hypothetical protein